MNQLMPSREKCSARSMQLAEILFQAGQLAQAMQQQGMEKLGKGGKDFATAADLAVQQQIVTQLTHTLPDLPIVGEEDAQHQIPAEEFIVVDPIDGTFLYAAGSDAWGITLAIIKDYQPILGFIYQPARARLVYAERGYGCYLNGQPAQLAPKAPLEQCILALAQGCWNSLEELQQVNIPLSHSSLFALCPGSAVDAGMEMLQGVCAAYLNNVGKIWDFAALALAVEEAGGTVTSPGGNPLRWDSISMPCLFANCTDVQQEITAKVPTAFRF